MIGVIYEVQAYGDASTKPSESSLALTKSALLIHGYQSSRRNRSL